MGDFERFQRLILRAPFFSAKAATLKLTYSKGWEK